jgi:hypothetical protein
MKNRNRRSELPIRRISRVPEIEEEVFGERPLQKHTEEDHSSTRYEKDPQIVRYWLLEEDRAMIEGKKANQKRKIISPTIDNTPYTRSKKRYRNKNNDICPYGKIVFCPNNTIFPPDMVVRYSTYKCYEEEFLEKGKS